MTRMIELTDLQAECLACALADETNDLAQDLRRRTDATGVGGVIAAMFVASEIERAQLVACMRQALDFQRAKCLGDATAAVCVAARRAVCSAG